MGGLGWMYSPLRTFTCAWCGKEQQTRHHSKFTCDRKCLNKFRSTQITEARRAERDEDNEPELTPEEIDRRFAVALRAAKGKYHIDPWERSGPNVFEDIENILDC